VETVLHVAQPRVGGVPAVVAAYVSHQARGERRVVVASSSVGALPEAVRAAGGVHVPWEARREPGPASFVEARALARIVAQFEPDLVHLHSAKAGLAGRLAVRGRRPTIFQPHMWSFQAAAGVVHHAAVRWERFATRWTDMLVCVSEAERELGARKGVDGRFAVVPNGVDLSRFEPKDQEGARARLGLEAGPLAVCVGRIAPEKGQALLVSAWPRVQERVRDARLVLVGDGPDAAGLRERLPSAVTLVGDRDDVPDWVAAADVVVVPSLWEGMSLVMLEAMGAARPVVSTDVPGAREALRDGAGAVVPIESRALADAVAERLVDPELARREGLRARSVAERSHDIHDVVSRIDALYDVLLSSTSRAPL
jgi:glycosyltransferase involved in cell wall biosynthesis